MPSSLFWFLRLILLSLLPLACSGQERIVPSIHGDQPQQFVLRFATLLAERNFSAAYAMTAESYQATTTREQMQREFETMIPLDWGR